MNQVEEINKFLILLSDVAKTEDLQSDKVAEMLQQYDVPAENFGRAIIERDKLSIIGANNYNNEQTICTFDDIEDFNKVNAGFKTRPNNNTLDMPVNHTIVFSVDPVFYADVFGKIIEVLVNNNILSTSKMATTYRNSSIEIGVENISDLRNILVSIAQLNIDKMLINRHPFTDGSNGIGIIMNWDNSSSYINYIATTLAQYIELRKKDNKLNEVNIEDFNYCLKNVFRADNEIDNKKIMVISENIDEIQRNNNRNPKLINSFEPKAA